MDLGTFSNFNQGIGNAANMQMKLDGGIAGQLQGQRDMTNQIRMGQAAGLMGMGGQLLGGPEGLLKTGAAFASPFTGADVGEHASPFIAYGANRGVSTTTHGFTVSRASPGNVKERFAFGSPASGADVGEVASGLDDGCCHGV